ncbi:MAG TPA: hypothetical protein VIH17_08295 [Candidatus Acidoferrales bacterium]
MHWGLGKKVLVLATMLLLGLSAMPGLAAADTLELRNGRVWHGKYAGGTANTIRFRIGGEVQVFETRQVLALTLDSTETAEPFEAPTAPAAPTSPGGPTSPTRAAASRSVGTITVPAGTPIVVRMIDTVDSERNRVGDAFLASLEEPIVVDDQVVASKGADVEGRLSEVKEAGRIAGKSELLLELTAITINGQRYAISTGNYEVAGEGRGKRSAQVIGGGAAIGAVIGAIAGGGKGAAIGAATGAGAGTAIQVLTKGEQVRVPSETRLSFDLNRPLVVNLR